VVIEIILTNENIDGLIVASLTHSQKITKKYNDVLIRRIRNAKNIDDVEKITWESDETNGNDLARPGKIRGALKKWIQ